jgi:hypothetical protein
MADDDHRGRIGRQPQADEGGAGHDPAGGLDGLFPDLRAGDFAITRDGTWWHDGKAIPRQDLVKLFATVLRREDNGGYALITPAERARVHVEDAPFIAEELEVTRDGGQQVLWFRSNVDRWVDAGPEHPVHVVEAADGGEPSPYILMSPGLHARIARSVFYHLAELAVYGPHEGREVLGVWSRGTFFPLDPSGTA